MQLIDLNQFKPDSIMFTDDQLTKLRGLFKETGPAHHQAYIDTDGDDPEWPMWYAEYMHEKLMDILNLELTKSELVYLLVAADLDHQDEDPDANWAEYYTKFFADHLS